MGRALPSGRSTYLRFEGSDHRPLLTNFDTSTTKRKGIFQYDRRLGKNSEIKQLIAQVWSANPSAMVEQRIGSSRHVISCWNKDNHKNSRKLVEEKKQNLDDELSKASADEALINSLNSELKEAYQAEEEFWRQRSRQLWLTLGDKNSGYFHAITRGR